MPNRARPALLAKLIVSNAVQIALFGALLFGPAGTLDWWRAWVFLAVLALLSAVVSAGLLRASAELIAERLKPPVQRGQPLADRVITLLMLAAFVGQAALIPVDVFRLHLLPRPGVAISSFGMAMLLAGYWVAYRAMRENAYASAVVRYQEEREHRLVDTGPYRVVRHPMYSGAILFLVGMPLWLESFAGALAAVVPVALMISRIFTEEALLRRDLAGYEDYSRRVRFRLVPFVW